MPKKAHLNLYLSYSFKKLMLQLNAANTDLLNPSESVKDQNTECQNVPISLHTNPVKVSWS